MIWASIFSLILLALIVQPACCEDWPDCKFQCQANDVTISRLWLGDDRGDDQFSAVPGEKQSCYLWATFHNNANTPRYAVILLADLYQAGTLSRSFYDGGLCVRDEIDAKSTADYPLINIVWTGGEEVKLKRLVLSWETAKGTSCSRADRKCSNRNTKCYGGPEAEFLVQTPLSAIFAGDMQDCTGFVKFVDQTTGGIGPYAYDWDFGDGFHSTEEDPAHTYDIPGNYTARLQARDRSGRVASVSRQFAFDLCPCTIIGQDHTCLGKIESYKVTLPGSIHGSIQWHLDGREIDGGASQEESHDSNDLHDGESINIDWQDFGQGLHDLGVYVTGANGENGPRLWAACNMTINVTPEPVAAISWVV
jgi:hypothetical protein